MKRFFLFLSAGLLFASTGLKAQSNPDEAVKFETEVHNFGKIKQGVPVNYDFAFKNIGKTPVTVEVATASCGCTTPKWDQAPIMPGKTSKINAGFNAQNPGSFEKTITVKFQGMEAPKMIKIMGEVVTGDAVAPAEASPEMVKAATPVPVPAVAPTAKTPATAKTARKAKTVKKAKVK
jgi:hypothetical protein